MNIFIAEIIDGMALLNKEESLHCAKVLRKKVGEKIRLIDGKGSFFDAELIQVSEKQCKAKVIHSERATSQRDHYLHLAISPTKQNERIEWMLEKCVEIGIDEITFLKCRNSERIVIKTERMKKIVEGAVKQSLQALIPKVNELISFKEFVMNCSEEQKLIAHCDSGDKKLLKEKSFKDKRTLILIGPEGDFDQEEIKLALTNSFQAVSLGSTRLRTETAGLYACQAISILSSL